MSTIKVYLTNLAGKIAKWWLMGLSLLTLFLLLSSLFLANCIYASEIRETPIPPAPTQWVTDTSNFISTQTAQELNTRLENYERATGHQVLVYIGQTTGSVPISDWAVKAFEAWKVGRKGIDDGLVLFIMANDKQLRIEVGYGLEAQVTDAMAARIIRDVMVPKLKAGDNDGAVIAGVDNILNITGGEKFSSTKEPPRKPVPVPLWQQIGLVIIGILFLILLITHPSLAFYLIVNILSGGRQGGSDGMGGGGFRGGGGRSGGGGASGSW